MKGRITYIIMNIYPIVARKGSLESRQHKRITITITTTTILFTFLN